MHNLAGLSRQHVIAKPSRGFSFPLRSSKACREEVRLEGRRLSRRHRRGWSRWSVHCCVSRRHCSRTTGERCFLWNNSLACNRSLASFNNVTPVSSKNCTSRLDKETTRTRRIQTGSWCPDLLPRQSHTHHFTRANVRKGLCVSIIVFLLTTFPVRHSTYIVTQWITRPQKLGLGQGSLSTRVFETRTATGREQFAFLDRIVSQISLMEKRYLAMWMWLCENSSLPVAVRVSKTRMLKLPRRELKHARA